jgi:hypothetical protein
MPLNKGYSTKKHHCDTKSEPAYLTFAQFKTKKNDIQMFYFECAFQGVLNPTPLRDSPQLKWKEDLHKTCNISKNKLATKRTQSLHLSSWLDTNYRQQKNPRKQIHMRIWRIKLLENNPTWLTSFPQPKMSLKQGHRHCKI